MPLIQRFSSCCEALLHLVYDIAMVKYGSSIIDFCCNFMVILQLYLC
jgi:hypothetical protein